MANGNPDQIIHFIHRKLFSERPVYTNYCIRISNYATASIDSAAYIIGGYDGSGIVSTIAEYKNNRWKAIGNLHEVKQSLSAIPNKGEYIVVGGLVDSGR